MRRNKVCPLDNVGRRPIKAFEQGSNSGQRADGVSRQPNDLQHRQIVAGASANTRTPSTVPQPHTNTFLAAGGPSQLPNKRKTATANIVTEKTASRLQSLHLKRLVAVDSDTHHSVEEQAVDGDSEPPAAVTAPCTIAEENMMEESEINSNASSGDQDLLEYFTELNNNEDSEIDMNMATRILLEGADVSARGINGQTCVHLAAAHWQKEVLQFLKENGANLHEPDDFGVTPLHEAARVDNEEVVNYLIESYPNISQVTSDTLQTALHYAVLGNAINSIYILVEAGADLEARDHRGRTPLHLAAERDRTAAALVLLSLDKPAIGSTCDDSGHSALISLIQNMPEVTHLALDQLQKLVTVKRSQHFYLSALEPAKTRGDKISCNTPLQEIVYWQRYELLTHPVISKLLEVKWRRSGRMAFIVHGLLYMLFLAAWTVFISTPVHRYDLPCDWWRIVILIIAMATLVQQVAEEVWEYWYSSRQKMTYKKWRTKELMRDLALTRGHPEEMEYLNRKISELNRPNYYFQDEWNFIDIVTFITLFVIIVTHFVDVAIRDSTTVVGTLHVRISCLAVILIWCRLFKLGRVFPTISPYIAVIRGLVADIIRFVVVYLVLYIPYLICFWIIFSSVDKKVEGSEELTKVHRMAFMLFRMTLIDEYPYNAMRKEDEVMTLILVGTFLFFTAVVGLNLFIALLSNTFQRVYDNTLANSEMQRTRLMLQLENVYSHFLIDQRYLNYIHNNCDPLVCTFNDNDVLNEQDLRRATLQVRSAVKRIEQHLISQDTLLKEQHERLQHEISSLQLTLNSHFKIPSTTSKPMLPPLKQRKGLSSYPLTQLLHNSKLHSSTESLQDSRHIASSPRPLHRNSLRWVRSIPEE